ncbi:MAG: alpha-E domain-containing protein [Gemmataceae bacterium]
MLSRVAENLYWIARYVERADNVARLLDDAYHRELDVGATGGRPLAAVVRMLGCHETLPDDDRGRAMSYLSFDRAGSSSIRSMIARARENARGTQEALSSEAWSHLNQLHLYLNGPKARARLESSPLRFLDRVRRDCLLFEALVDGTLPRTEVFHFLQLGRYLERVDMTSRILQARFQGGAPGEGIATWVGLLRSCSAHEAYLQQARERIDPVGVVGFLVLRPDFPRSLRFGVARGLESLRAIAGDGAWGAPAERQLGRLDGDLRYADADELFVRGVGEFLVDVQEACALAASEIHRAYFLN